MQTISESIDVHAPIRTVYDVWTRFEDFPRFMEHIERVERVDDSMIRWHASIDGKDEDWVSEITEQSPDHRIAWRSVEGAKNAGEVTFQSLDSERTRVTLSLEYDPDGLLESLGAALGFMDRNVRDDLERFRTMLEEQRSDTGRMANRVEHTERERS